MLKLWLQASSAIIYMYVSVCYSFVSNMQCRKLVSVDPTGDYFTNCNFNKWQLSPSFIKDKCKIFAAYSNSNVRIFAYPQFSISSILSIFLFWTKLALSRHLKMWNMISFLLFSCILETQQWIWIWKNNHDLRCHYRSTVKLAKMTEKEKENTEPKEWLRVKYYWFQSYWNKATFSVSLVDLLSVCLLLIHNKTKSFQLACPTSFNECMTSLEPQPSSNLLRSTQRRYPEARPSSRPQTPLKGGAAVWALTHCLCLVMCRCVWFTLAQHRAILVLYIHVVDKVTDECLLLGGIERIANSQIVVY